VSSTRLATTGVDAQVAVLDHLGLKLAALGARRGAGSTCPRDEPSG
jgi:hypothetical protein